MSHQPNPRGWNTFRKGGIRSSTPTLAAPKFKPGPIVSITTLVATKGQDTYTATWHDGELASFADQLSFLKGCDLFEVRPLLQSHGWSGKWHDSSMQLPVPL